MVPCCAIESFVSVVNPSISVDCEILRDCYESFAMYCFGRYLVACLGGKERTIEFMEREGHSSSKTPLFEHNSERGTVKLPFPVNYFLKPWKLGQWFYQIVKFGIVQYKLIKSLSAITAVILEAFGVYCEGEFELGYGYPYIAVVLNFSQSWALYCLVQFYTATKDESAHIKPLAKILTFKSIVFLTWWQGVATALLYTLGLFKSPITQGLKFKSPITQGLKFKSPITQGLKFNKYPRFHHLHRERILVYMLDLGGYFISYPTRQLMSDFVANCLVSYGGFSSIISKYVHYSVI
ncbi:Protein LAZ1 [Quillaja saponaria]|uniref:Protein LAZ1 n=1 Tax=Quillaja saponaria TaxID=32244 RepID=A0AAD7VK36_QUISA|nr:Protein LAZ1 [Quillaja saponaria]